MDLFLLLIFLLLLGLSDLGHRIWITSAGIRCGFGCRRCGVGTGGLAGTRCRHGGVQWCPVVSSGVFPFSVTEELDSLVDPRIPGFCNSGFQTESGMDPVDMGGCLAVCWGWQAEIPDGWVRSKLLIKFLCSGSELVPPSCRPRAFLELVHLSGVAGGAKSGCQGPPRQWVDQLGPPAPGLPPVH